MLHLNKWRLQPLPDLYQECSMKLNFKQWLNEVATSTADVAVFARPIMGVVRRHYPWTEEDPFFKKKKKKLEHYRECPSI